MKKEIEIRKNQQLSINIPDEILYNRELTANSKLLYGEIARLCGDIGSCYATNRALGSLLNVSVRAITDMIKQLRDNKYITTVNVANAQTNQSMRVISLKK